MRAIDADAYLNKMKPHGISEEIWKESNIYKSVTNMPTIQPEIIHCGDGCKFWDKFAGEQKGTCYILRQCTSENFYCGNAKRRER